MVGTDRKKICNENFPTWVGDAKRPKNTEAMNSSVRAWGKEEEEYLPFQQLKVEDE